MVAKNIPSICLSCGGCVGVCPQDAISLKDMKIIIDVSKCNGCGTCVIFCPVGAMTLEDKSANDVER